MHPERSAPHSPLRRLTRYCVVFASVAVLAMMVIAAADVVGTLFSVPISGAFEFVAMLMVLVVFLALPDAEYRDQHIAVDLVTARLRPRGKHILAIVNGLIALVFFGAMAWQGWKLFFDSWAIREYSGGAVRFPIYPAKALFAIGVSVSVLVIVVKLIRLLQQKALIEEPASANIQKGL